MIKRIKKFAHEHKLDRMKKFPVMETAIAATVLIVLAGLFIDTRKMGPEGPSRLAQSGGSNALEFDVVNVNTIIAKDFGLPHVSGVLVNNAPKGVTRRLIDLRRGDIILKYNSIDVQSANHLSYLMAQSKPGDTVSFVIWRNYKLITMTDKIPVNAGINVFGAQGRDIMIVLVILIVTFTMLFLNLFNRTVCVTLGAVLMLAAGSACGFYNQSEAFDAIRLSPIFIFIGMSIFSIVLNDLRFFEYLAKRIILALKADRLKVILALCAMTAVASALMNNISVILVMVPVTIYAAKGLGFDPIPVVISEVIASTIGGNATPIGDFSNMLVATTAGFSFLEFGIYIMPVCVISFVVFMAYMWFSEFRHQKKNGAVKLEKEFLKAVRDEVDAMDIDWLSVRKALYVLGAVLIAFMVLPLLKIRLAPIALGGGFILLAILNDKAKDVMKKISLTDVIFFIALFIMVGGALYSGLLKVVSNTLTAMSMGNQIFYMILLLWTTAIFTSFLNSGPACAFFIPIVLHSGYADFTDVVWWSVTLGTLAGGVACLTGASAGIISQTLVDELHTAHMDGKVKEGITFVSYCRRGIPAALMILVISSVYLAVLSVLP